MGRSGDTTCWIRKNRNRCCRVLWNSFAIRLFYFVCGCGNIPAAAGIWRYVHYTCSSTVKCRGRSDPGGKGETGVRGVGKMTSPHALIHDEDGIREIPAADLIPGDIVCLEAGRQVPADIRIISAVNLKIEESALTGESVPVSKIRPIRTRHI